VTDDNPFISDKLMLIVVIVICFVWALSMTATFVSDKSPPEGINIAFGAVTGYLFNKQIRRDT
jgi:hypothetical protein